MKSSASPGKVSNLLTEIVAAIHTSHEPNVT